MKCTRFNLKTFPDSMTVLCPQNTFTILPTDAYPKTFHYTQSTRMRKGPKIQMPWLIFALMEIQNNNGFPNLRENASHRHRSLGLTIRIVGRTTSEETTHWCDMCEDTGPTRPLRFPIDKKHVGTNFPTDEIPA